MYGDRLLLDERAIGDIQSESALRCAADNLQPSGQLGATAMESIREMSVSSHWQISTTNPSCVTVSGQPRGSDTHPGGGIPRCRDPLLMAHTQRIRQYISRIILPARHCLRIYCMCSAGKNSHHDHSGEIALSDWKQDELHMIAETDDLHIAPFREDGQA